MTKVIMPSAPLKFQPQKWNRAGSVRRFNCYSYALNTKKHGWLPLNGVFSNNNSIVRFLMESDFDQRLSDDIIAALWLTLDGLERIRKHEYSPLDTHIIAYDHFNRHFYRLDADNIWSHKNGQSKATRRDGQEKTIEDVEEAKLYGRKPVADEILYFRIPPKGMVVDNHDVHEHPMFVDIAHSCPPFPDSDNEAAMEEYGEQRCTWELQRNAFLKKALTP